MRQKKRLTLSECSGLYIHYNSHLEDFLCQLMEQPEQYVAKCM